MIRTGADHGAKGLKMRSIARATAAIWTASIVAVVILAALCAPARAALDKLYVDNITFTPATLVAGQPFTVTGTLRGTPAGGVRLKLQYQIWWFREGPHNATEDITLSFIDLPSVAESGTPFEIRAVAPWDVAGIDKEATGPGSEVAGGPNGKLLYIFRTDSSYGNNAYITNQWANLTAPPGYVAPSGEATIRGVITGFNSQPVAGRYCDISATVAGLSTGPVKIILCYQRNLVFPNGHTATGDVPIGVVTLPSLSGRADVKFRVMVPMNNGFGHMRYAYGLKALASVGGKLAYLQWFRMMTLPGGNGDPGDPGDPGGNGDPGEGDRGKKPAAALAGTVAKFKSDPLGITVRDMTYAYRRRLRKADDDPGVVVSKVEPGSKASVAGVKPYETITHVNDQPVMTVKDFERLIAGQTELRLSVKRMVQGRVVKITLGPPAAPEGASPAPEPAAAPTPSGEGAAP